MSEILPPIALQVAFVSGTTRLTTKPKAPITRVEWDNTPRVGDTFSIRIPAGTVEQQREAIADRVGEIVDDLRARHRAELDPDSLPENIYRAEKARRAGRLNGPLSEARTQFEAEEAARIARTPHSKVKR